MSEESPSVTFKYLLPEHQKDASMALNAVKAFGILWDIDQMCRRILKYEDIPEDSERKRLAQEIRSLIREEVNLDDYI